MIVLNDKTCPSCDVSGLVATTKELFPGAVFKNVDAASDEGKALIKKYDLLLAPTLLFSEEVVETKTWKGETKMASFFDKTIDGYKLKDSAIGAKWFFDAEKQKAAEEAAKLAAEEAAKAAKEKLNLVTGDNKPQVDFFVMAFCPFGNQAEELLKPVFDVLKDDAIFTPRYVIYAQGSGCYTDDDGTQLCSMHGAQELNQGMRELCVFKELGSAAWFDFAIAVNDKCSSSNADSCWKGVAEDLGYDTAKIQSCFDTNKVKYAREEYELNKALSVSGSPTLFFEGQKYAGGRSSNGYLAALCAGFEDAPAACSDSLDEAPSTAPTGNCG